GIRDDLVTGVQTCALPISYRVSRDFGGADVTVPGAQYAIYAGDRWEVASNFTVTYGLRADIPVLSATPPYAGKVDTILGRRTDEIGRASCREREKMRVGAG